MSAHLVRNELNFGSTAWCDKGLKYAMSEAKSQPLTYFFRLTTLVLLGGIFSFSAAVKWPVGISFLQKLGFACWQNNKEAWLMAQLVALCKVCTCRGDGLGAFPDSKWSRPTKKFLYCFRWNDFFDSWPFFLVPVSIRLHWDRKFATLNPENGTDSNVACPFSRKIRRWETFNPFCSH